MRARRHISACFLECSKMPTLWQRYLAIPYAFHLKPRHGQVLRSRRPSTSPEQLPLNSYLPKYCKPPPQFPPPHPPRRPYSAWGFGGAAPGLSTPADRQHAVHAIILRTLFPHLLISLEHPHCSSSLRELPCRILLLQNFTHSTNDNQAGDGT